MHLVALVTADRGSLEHLRGEVSCDLGDADGATCLLEGDAQALRLYGGEADDTLVADGRQAIGGRYGLEDTGARLRLDAEALDTLPEGDVLLQDEGIEARGAGEAVEEVAARHAVSHSPVGLRLAVVREVGGELLITATEVRCGDSDTTELVVTEGLLQVVVPSDEARRVLCRDAAV